MTTNKEFTMRFMGHERISVPKGTPVGSVVGGGGKLYYYLSSTYFMFSQLWNVISLLNHDLKYNYVYIEEKYVDFS